MPSRKKRAMRRQRRSKVLPALIMCLSVFAVILVVMLIMSDPLTPVYEKDKNVRFPENPNFIEQANATVVPLVVQQATYAPEVQPTIMPSIVAENILKEEVYEGNSIIPSALPYDYFLPVFDRANLSPNDEAMIAVTVDNCDDAQVMTEIVRIARYYDADLTLFPTGEALMTPGLMEGFKTCAEDYGYEIENHSFSLKHEYRLSGGELALETWKQSIACSYALGGDYQQHFYRPIRTESNYDQRTHFFINKLGYYGIGSYTHSYSEFETLDEIVDTLKSGNIYQFDMSEESMALFENFIRASSEKGYRLVTMNELFSLPENTLSDELTIDRQILPTMEGYVASYYDLKLNYRTIAVAELQARLLELGYLDPEDRTNRADGNYGANTSIAVSKFQAKVSLPATGDADVETQQKLFAADAPAND